MQNGEGLEGGDENGTIEVSGRRSAGLGGRQTEDGTHPMAKVLQSAAGAMAVIGSKMVRAA